MTEDSSTEPDRPAAELASVPIKWEMSAEEIEAMSPEQLRQEVINLNEKVRRLYEVAMLGVNRAALDYHVKPQDIDGILNPEKT